MTTNIKQDHGCKMEVSPSSASAGEVQNTMPQTINEIEPAAIDKKQFNGWNYAIIAYIAGLLVQFVCLVHSFGVYPRIPHILFVIYSFYFLLIFDFLMLVRFLIARVFKEQNRAWVIYYFLHCTSGVWVTTIFYIAQYKILK